MFLNHFANMSCLLIQSFIAANDDWISSIFSFIDTFSAIRSSTCFFRPMLSWWRDEISSSLSDNFFRRSSTCFFRPMLSWWRDEISSSLLDNFWRRSSIDSCKLLINSRSRDFCMSKSHTRSSSWQTSRSLSLSFSSMVFLGGVF